MHFGVISKARTNCFFPLWVRQRELRQRFPLGYSDVFYESLYSSISPCHSWGRGETSKSGHGGLFSLDFSQDGTLLVAGCELNRLLVFDPLSRRLIRTVHNAHAGCVTIVKFLDSRKFATGSVDRTVALWDARNLKSQIRTLRGYSSTIGNIEFSSKDDLLITSGVEGFISTWDVNNAVQAEGYCKKIFRSYVLMRLRLNPDETKMIISTARGYIMIVHELDLNTLAQDLDEFELEMFRFAYLHQTTSSPYQNWSRFVFPHRRRNRVEIVADFPNAGGFNVISALEIHPQGWSVFSRSTSDVSGKEWTCVHDIQKKEPSEGGDAAREGSGEAGFPWPQQDDPMRAKRRRVDSINKERSSTRWDGGSTCGLECGSAGSSSNNSGSEMLQRSSVESLGVRCEAGKWTVPESASCLKREQCSGRASSAAHGARSKSPLPGPCSVPPGPLELASRKINLATSQLPTSVLSSFITSDSSDSLLDHNVHESFPRLTHYIEEPVASEWYSECLSVSSDGRLICSPFDYGIRLLSFSPECSEQSLFKCGTKPRRLHELSTHISHSDSVICTKFSPRHCVLVSGCYGGKLAWYQPIV